MMMRRKETKFRLLPNIFESLKIFFFGKICQNRKLFSNLFKRANRYIDISSNCNLLKILNDSRFEIVILQFLKQIFREIS